MSRTRLLLGVTLLVLAHGVGAQMITVHLSISASPANLGPGGTTNVTAIFSPDQAINGSVNLFSLPATGGQNNVTFGTAVVTPSSAFTCVTDKTSDNYAEVRCNGSGAYAANSTAKVVVPTTVVNPPQGINARASVTAGQQFGDATATITIGAAAPDGADLTPRLSAKGSDVVPVGRSKSSFFYIANVGTRASEGQWSVTLTTSGTAAGGRAFFNWSGLPTLDSTDPNVFFVVIPPGVEHSYGEVFVTASGPGSVIVTATVSGGSDINPANNTSPPLTLTAKNIVESSVGDIFLSFLTGGRVH